MTEATGHEPGSGRAAGANTYCYPRIARVGLGNSMLPWARALVHSRRTGAAMLAPRWVQPRLGSVLRREPVKRFYWGEFTNAGYVKGLRRFLILARGRTVPEASAVAVQPHGDRPTVVEFAGLGDYFAPLRSSWRLIGEELVRIAEPAIVARASAVSGPFIALHVRRGDVTRQKVVAPETMVQFTPTQWFVDALVALQRLPRWRNLPVLLFSDGSDDELLPLLGLPGCRRAATGSSLGDMLALANASLLLASGHSTFSMWASFMGRMPTLYAPGKLQQTLFDDDTAAFEGEWAPGTALPGAVL